MLRRLVTARGPACSRSRRPPPCSGGTGDDADVVAAAAFATRSSTSRWCRRARPRAQLDRALLFLTGLILGSAVVALLVASLAVTNTMFTAVVRAAARDRAATRRRRDAPPGSPTVVRGGAWPWASPGAWSGWPRAWPRPTGLNLLTERVGASIFLVTPRSSPVALLLPPAWPALAGLWPAWRAARLCPLSGAVRVTSTRSRSGALPDVATAGSDRGRPRRRRRRRRGRCAPRRCGRLRLGRSPRPGAPSSAARSSAAGSSGGTT